jgi:hypothetical protein
MAASEDLVGEGAAVAALHQLNADWIRAFTDCDDAWYNEHLRDDFVCTLADGRRINKHEFVRHLREGPRVKTIGCDEIDVHLLDIAVALVHGVIHLRGQTSASMRYTMLWQAKQNHWQAVAAQFTSLERGPSAKNDVDVRPLASEGTKSRKRRRLRMIPARVPGLRARVLELHRPPSLTYGGSFRADGAAGQGWSEVWVPLQPSEDRPLLCAERRSVWVTT